jgi:sugar lactone lactonase YvrE
LAEGPVWDAKRQVICWVDILNGEIHEYSRQHKIHNTISVQQMIGSMAICDNGDFIVALQNGFAFVNRLDGKIKIIADPEASLPNSRFNDGKCDPAGRFWAGTMSLSEDKGAGSLYMLDRDLKYSKKISDVTISNGMSWSRDHKTFYYIDTPTHEVVAYDYSKQTGEISNRRVIIQINERDGFPDGMTIDNEGMLWIAHWNGWQVTRWNAQTGEKLHTIKMPVAKVTSCTFGGKDLDSLYITTAKVELTEEEQKQQPLAGSLFVIDHCGYKGVPAVEFRVF